MLNIYHIYYQHLNNIINTGFNNLITIILNNSYLLIFYVNNLYIY